MMAWSSAVCALYALPQVVRRCKRFAVTQGIIKEVDHRGQEAFSNFTWCESSLSLLNLLPLHLWYCGPSLCPFSFISTSYWMISACPTYFYQCQIPWHSEVLWPSCMWLWQKGLPHLCVACSRVSQCWLLFLHIGLVILGESSFSFEYAIYAEEMWWISCRFLYLQHAGSRNVDLVFCS